MAKLAGTKGWVGASVSIAGINQWTLDYTVDMLETTDFSASGIASYIPGVSRWSGTFGGYKDGAPKSLGVATAIDLWLVESATAGVASASAETNVWTGQAYISGIHPSTNFDGIASYSYDFQGTASITIPTT